MSVSLVLHISVAAELFEGRLAGAGTLKPNVFGSAERELMRTVVCSPKTVISLKHNVYI